MSFRSWLLAPVTGFLTGKAISRFHRRDYKTATRLFERVLKLDSAPDRAELYYAYLGRSYLELGRHEDALAWLLRAYEPFCSRSSNLKGAYERGMFVEFLKALRAAYRETGQPGLADDVAAELAKFR